MERTELLLVSADGSEHRSLTQGMLPRWSPAGDLILFTRVDSTPCQGKRSRSSTALYTIRPDGSDEHLLAPDALAGRWSPDGSTVALLRGIPILFSFAGPELFLVNADGSGERSLGRFPLP